VLRGKRVFERDCKECVAKLGWVVGIPEEGVIGIGADKRCVAGIRNIRETEVGGIGYDGPEQAEDVQAQNVDVLLEVLGLEPHVNPLVGGQACCLRKGGVPSGSGEQAHIEEIGNDEVPSPGPAQRTFAVNDALGYLAAKGIGGAGGGIENIVSAALNDVEGIGVGFSAGCCQVGFNLLGNARDAGKGRRLCHLGAAESEIGSL